jgi:IclR family acetate operon transcriptional repressor
MYLWNCGSIIWNCDAQRGREPMNRQTGSQAVDRAAGLLVSVLAAPAAVSFGELVSASELPKSTVSRLLGSLERQGLVQRTVNGAVRPGPALTRFAHSAGATDSLVELSRPCLAEVARETGETVNLAIPGPTAVDQIAQVDSSFLLGAVNWVGRGVAFHGSAVGKVFLAYGVAVLPAGRLDRLTDRTITSRVALEQEFAGIRAQGYAVADSELEPGLVAIAAPVRGATGVVVGAVSVSGPALRITPDRFNDIGRLLVRATNDLSTALGHPTEADHRSVRQPRAGRVGAA